MLWARKNDKNNLQHLASVGDEAVIIVGFYTDFSIEPTSKSEPWLSLIFVGVP
jgi:hypothetical protein